jgi:CheY-like chemotaxis protein
VIVIRLGPALRDVIRDREFRAAGGPAGVELSVGGQPVSTQQAIDDQRRETEAVRSEMSLLAAELVELRAQLAGGADTGHLRAVSTKSPYVSTPIESAAHGSIRRLLWVDDQPRKNAYELAALRDRAIDIVEAISTSAALDYVAEHPRSVDAIVTDMHRVEDGHVRPEAGLELLKALDAQSNRLPTVVYTSVRSAARYGDAVRQFGALGATASATELFELLGINIGPRMGVTLRAQVAMALARRGIADLGARSDGFDFTIRHQDRVIGIEVKGWLPPVEDRAIEAAVTRLANVVHRGGVDEAWLVSGRPLATAERAGRAGGRVRLLTVDALSADDLWS